MMIPYIDIYGRIADQITSGEGQQHYYEHIDYRRTCVSNTDPVIAPMPEDVKAYMELKAIDNNLILRDTTEDKRRYNQLRNYDIRYDWRPHKSGKDGYYGLVAPDGKKLLHDEFADVFTQFDAVNSLPKFVPVSDGESWGHRSPHLPCLFLISSTRTFPSNDGNTDYISFRTKTWLSGVLSVPRLAG